MSKLDNFIEKFFENIKRRQANRIKKDFRKENPDLSKKLDKINKAYSDLDEYLLNTQKDEEEELKDKDRIEN